MRTSSDASVGQVRVQDARLRQALMSLSGQTAPEPQQSCSFFVLSRKLCVGRACNSYEDDKEGAMAMYRRGVAELELGVAVDVDGRGEQYDRARRLRDKMMANLTMARDRLTILDSIAHLRELSVDGASPPHLPPHESPQHSPNRSRRRTYIKHHDQPSKWGVRLPQDANPPHSPRVPLENRRGTPEINRVNEDEEDCDYTAVINRSVLAANHPPSPTVRVRNPNVCPSPSNLYPCNLGKRSASPRKRSPAREFFPEEQSFSSFSDSPIFSATSRSGVSAKSSPRRNVSSAPEHNGKNVPPHTGAALPSPNVSSKNVLHTSVALPSSNTANVLPRNVANVASKNVIEKPKARVRPQVQVTPAFTFTYSSNFPQSPSTGVHRAVPGLEANTSSSPVATKKSSSAPSAIRPANQRAPVARRSANPSTASPTPKVGPKVDTGLRRGVHTAPKTNTQVGTCMPKFSLPLREAGPPLVGEVEMHNEDSSSSSVLDAVFPLRRCPPPLRGLITTLQGS
ncbi:hypothetical protein FHG87_010645 [Trinorchestia longiramus]|nr:hypothetical protein FHG87_010645 [Trinorchestia longiramus]